MVRILLGISGMSNRTGTLLATLIAVSLAACTEGGVAAEYDDTTADVGSVRVAVSVRLFVDGAEVPCSAVAPLELEVVPRHGDFEPSPAEQVYCASELAAPASRIGSTTFAYDVPAGALDHEVQLAAADGPLLGVPFTVALEQGTDSAWRFVSAELPALAAE